MITEEEAKTIVPTSPVGRSTDECLETLAQAGVIEWNGGRLAPLAPVAHAEADHTVADLLLENRV